MRRKPFLTAKRLLTNQTFRDIYRTETLDIDQRLKITSLTFLFTDLRGSTAMYERVGDLNAYDLVKAHFRVLHDIVAAGIGRTAMGVAVRLNRRHRRSCAHLLDPADGVSQIELLLRQLLDIGFEFGAFCGARCIAQVGLVHGRGLLSYCIHGRPPGREPG
jgi:class 3 adenylate cyclase